MYVSQYTFIDRTLLPGRTAVQMPDVLTFTTGLPLKWVRTELYVKAAKLLLRHTSPRNTPQCHKISGDEYLVLTNEGVTKFKKVTKKLVDRSSTGCRTRTCTGHTYTNATYV